MHEHLIAVTLITSHFFFEFSFRYHIFTISDTFAVIVYWDSDVSDVSEYLMSSNEVTVVREKYLMVRDTHIFNSYVVYLLGVSYSSNL